MGKMDILKSRSIFLISKKTENPMDKELHLQNNKLWPRKVCYEDTHSTGKSCEGTLLGQKDTVRCAESGGSHCCDPLVQSPVAAFPAGLAPGSQVIQIKASYTILLTLRPEMLNAKIKKKKMSA